MNRSVKIWIVLMRFFEKYWGCHQMPERSFFCGRYQFPICARCTGILVGEIIYAVTVFFSFGLPFWLCCLMMLPMLADGTLQLKTGYRSVNRRRFITGLFFGYGMFATAIYLTAQIILAFEHQFILF